MCYWHNMVPLKSGMLPTRVLENALLWRGLLRILLSFNFDPIVLTNSRSDSRNTP